MKIKARTVMGRGEEGPLYNPGSELLNTTGRESESSARMINGMKKNKNRNNENHVQSGR